MRLHEKYKPKNTGEFIGSRKMIGEIKQMILNYSGKPIFIYGPSGVGKNLAIELIANDLGYELIELTASDFRDYESIKKTIFQSSVHHSLLGGNHLDETERKSGKIILVDELDLTDSGMMRGLKEVIEQSSYPIVLLASDPYSKQLYEIRRMSHLIRMDRVRSDILSSFLERVALAEGIPHDSVSINQLARMSDGDVRAALIDMESMGSVYNDRLKWLGNRSFEQPIFETLKIMLKSRNLEMSKMAMEQSDKEGGEIFSWLEENIFREYENPAEIAEAYDFLAKADYFQSLIMRRQSWGLQKYMADMLCCVSLARKEQNRKFVSYQPPRFSVRWGNGNGERDFLEKIGKATHTSRKIASGYIPLMKKLVKTKKSDTIGLTEEEKQIVKDF